MKKREGKRSKGAVRSQGENNLRRDPESGRGKGRCRAGREDQRFRSLQGREGPWVTLAYGS